MKTRLDQLLVARAFAASRTVAQALVLEGKVRVGGQVETKAGRMVPDDVKLEVESPPRFVSRGGEKLEGACAAFPGWAVDGLVCLDVGSSTGGFTDCLLQHGASRVYAVDVGRAQLHERLRADARVVSLEGVNLRTAPPDLLPERVEMVVADLSFISLTMVLPHCLPWLKPGGMAVCLIKPQFEVGPGQTDRGVVRDEALRARAVERVLEHMRGCGLESLGVVPASIKGPKGNQEFLAWWRKPAPAAEEAHAQG